MKEPLSGPVTLNSRIIFVAKNLTPIYLLTPGRARIVHSCSVRSAGSGRGRWGAIVLLQSRAGRGGVEGRQRPVPGGLPGWGATFGRARTAAVVARSSPLLPISFLLAAQHSLPNPVSTPKL